MSDKKESSARGLKHGLEVTVKKISHTMNKKRKIVELTIDQHLAPGLRDSAFGQLTEKVMFDILNYLSRKFSSFTRLIFLAMLVLFCRILFYSAEFSQWP